MNIADLRYQELLEEHTLHGDGIVERLINYLDNWNEISVIEAQCFNINPRLNNRLWLAYSRYQNMAGITDSGVWGEEEAQADRRDHGAYLASRDVKFIALFMSDVCHLPYKDCMGYTLFMLVAMYRSKVLFDEYEPYH